MLFERMRSMNENAEKLKELFKKKSSEAGKVSELEELRIEFLGKKGHIANLMSELRALPNDQERGRSEDKHDKTVHRDLHAGASPGAQGS